MILASASALPLIGEPWPSDSTPGSSTFRLENAAPARSMQTMQHARALAVGVGAGECVLEVESHRVHRNAGAIRIVFEVYAFKDCLHHLGGSEWNVQQLRDPPLGRCCPMGRVMDGKQDAAARIRKQVVARWERRDQHDIGRVTRRPWNPNEAAGAAARDITLQRDQPVSYTH